MRRDQGADRSHARQSRRPAGARAAGRPRRSRRPLQRRMRSAPKQPTNFLEPCLAAAPGRRIHSSRRPRSIPLRPTSSSDDRESIEKEKKGANAQAGSKAVCVRTCDGRFFPVSYSGAGSLGEGSRTCAARSAPTRTSRSTPSRRARSNRRCRQRRAIHGHAQRAEIPQSLDSTCSCRRKGESWADALADAEAKLGHESQGDMLVTPEKSAELSRPIDAKAAADPRPSRPSPAPRRRLNGIDDGPVPAAAAATRPRRRPRPTRADPRQSQRAERGAATISREASGIAGGDAQGGAKYSEGQGQTGRNRPRRSQAEGADNRADALTRPISGSRAASSGPLRGRSAPAAAGGTAPGPCGRSAP